MNKRNAYLPVSGVAGFLIGHGSDGPLLGAVIAIVLMWTARSINRRIAARRRVRRRNELKKQTETTWARTLDRLQIEANSRSARGSESSQDELAQKLARRKAENAGR